ncbi:MAG: SprB repeat-containing protein [Bacteroidetes bacterium]|nr:SprB repeat-containing protein [Bacteroidota bacterium]
MHQWSIFPGPLQRSIQCVTNPTCGFKQCFGGANHSNNFTTGGVFISVTGGLLPYTYSWSNKLATSQAPYRHYKFVLVVANQPSRLTVIALISCLKRHRYRIPNCCAFLFPSPVLIAIYHNRGNVLLPKALISASIK